MGQPGRAVAVVPLGSGARAIPVPALRAEKMETPVTALTARPSETVWRAHKPRIGDRNAQAHSVGCRASQGPAPCYVSTSWTISERRTDDLPCCCYPRAMSLDDLGLALTQLRLAPRPRGPSTAPPHRRQGGSMYAPRAADRPDRLEQLGGRGPVEDVAGGPASSTPGGSRGGPRGTVRASTLCGPAGPAGQPGR